MKRIITALTALILTASMLFACGSPAFDDLMKNITPGAVSSVKLVEVSNPAVTDFAVRLFRQSFDEEKNTLISPLSVMVALSMTANGAKNDTLAQMESVLGMPIEELNSFINSYVSNLPSGEKYKLSLANSIWIKDQLSFEVNKDFLQTNADYYRADIYKAPFSDSTCKEINSWVKEKTDGMIKDILDEIPADAIMYLINALAFDAEWQNIYEKHQIRDGIFTTEDGIERKAEMMYSTEGLYLEDKNAVGFIKYYKDRKYAFAALLPEEGMSISDYIETLDGESLNKLLSGAKYETVNTAVPKFETEYKAEMSDILSEMGMPDAFDGVKADFSGIGQAPEGNIRINRVIHQTYINVDGKGTKAGAATVVEMNTEGAMLPPEDPKEVYLDRPFVYMLIDCETNLPFFIGSMMDIK